MKSTPYMKNFGTIFLGLSALIACAAFMLLLPIGVVHGDSAASVCEGLQSTIGGTADCSPSAEEPAPDSLVASALNLLSLVAGVAAVIMMIVSGLHYITSQGNPQSASNARSSIIYVIVGLVIVAMAQTIVYFFL